MVEFWVVDQGRLSSFFFAWLEATETISLMFTLRYMFTVLKGLEMFSSPAKPVRYSSLLGSMAFFCCHGHLFCIEAVLGDL